VTHGDEIRAVYARNDLGPDEKHRRAYELKGNAYRAIADQIVDQPWTDGDLTVTITSLEVDAKHRVVVMCEARRGGVQLTLDLPLVYVNPPLVHHGVESPVAALRQAVMDTVARFG
jgi:hypothetical protein